MAKCGFKLPDLATYTMRSGSCSASSSDRAGCTHFGGGRPTGQWFLEGSGRNGWSRRPLAPRTDPAADGRADACARPPAVRRFRAIAGRAAIAVVRGACGSTALQKHLGKRALAWETKRDAHGERVLGPSGRPRCPAWACNRCAACAKRGQWRIGACPSAIRSVNISSQMIDGIAGSGYL